MNQNPTFSWVSTHKAIVEYLRRNRNRQDKLISLLRDAGINIMDDYGPRNKQIPLEEIDPFTFFCYIYKHGPDRRLALLSHVAEAIDAPLPDDDSGIPSAQAQKVQLYPYKKDRVDEIDRLWDFMESALKGAITDEQFADILSIKSVGKVKITEILFYVDPERYFPINGPARPYLEEELSIDTAFETFTDYKNILDQIKAKTTEPFYALSYRAWKWNSERAERNYWVFQGNPKRFDLPKSVADGTLNDWSVSAHKENIKPGDKVIIWMGGTEAGIYALAEVTTRPYDRTVQPNEESWSGESKFSKAVGIKVTHDLTTHPILRTEVFSTPGLKTLNAGTPGTNFKATEEQYEKVRELVSKRTMKRYWLYAPGEKANMWDEFYNDGVMRMGWPELGNLQRYKTKEEIQEVLQRKHNSDSSMNNWALANYEFCRVMQPGDIVIAKKGKTEYVGYGIVTSEYRYEPSLEDYRSYRMVDWKAKGLWEESEYSLVLKTLTDVTKNRDYVEKLKLLLAISEDQTITPKGMKGRLPYIPLNTILYGPPGTGKTFSTIKKALECIGDIAAENEERKLQRERFDQYVQQGRIVFSTFHQSMSYEDFIEGIKPEANDSNGHITYEVQDGLFKRISELAQSNWEASQSSRNGKLSFEESFSRFEEEWEENPDLKIPTKKKEYTITSIGKKAIAFRKASGGTAHTLSINTLREFFYEKREYPSGGLGVYYPGLVDKIRSYQGTEALTPLQNYVLIIDEINRGNVSQIFGELITLLEEDKRMGKKEQLRATLPYSGEEFGVPPNLYIIGTMNTADRSVEALDTALRRRFSFEEMPPRYDLPELKRVEYGVDIHELLKTINARIEKLLDRDHLIGHSYFMDRSMDLKSVFHNRIIPLLQEYFFGDYGKIGLVLGKGFVEVEENNTGSKLFADFDYDEVQDLTERRVYRIKWPGKMDPETFQTALRQLIKSN